LAGTVIALPWHLLMYSRWGDAFVSAYFGYHVFGRYAEGIGQNAGFQFFRYGHNIMVHGQPWMTAFLIILFFIVSRRLIRTPARSDVLPEVSVFSSIFIFCFFAFGRTAILTYILPAFPFIAVAVGDGFVSAFDWARSRQLKAAIILCFVILCGFAWARASGSDATTLETIYYPWAQTQEDIGRMVREGSEPDTTFYIFEWPTHEALRYYSGKELSIIGFPPQDGTVLTAPWFLMATNLHIPYFLNSDGTAKQAFENIEIKYRNESSQIFLLHSKEDLVLNSK
jgi:hypothetical protein